MILDLISLALLAISFYKGVSRGLILSAFSFVSLFVGMVVALRCSATVAQCFAGFEGIPLRWVPFLSFLLVFALAQWAVKLAGKFIASTAEAVMLGDLDKAGGVLLYALFYGITYSFILFYLTRLGIPDKATVDASWTYPWIAPLAPWALEWLKEIFPFLGDMLRIFQDFFRDRPEHITAPRA